MGVIMARFNLLRKNGQPGLLDYCLINGDAPAFTNGGLPWTVACDFITELHAELTEMAKADVNYHIALPVAFDKNSPANFNEFVPGEIGKLSDWLPAKDSNHRFHKKGYVPDIRFSAYGPYLEAANVLDDDGIADEIWYIGLDANGKLTSVAFAEGVQFNGSNY